MKSLTHTLTNYVAACCSGLWVETFEPDEAICEITALCREREWKLAVWDIDQGLQGVEKQAADPLSAIKAMAELGDGETPQLVVLRNFHRFLGSPEIVQAVEHQVQRGKVSRTYLIVLAPVVQVPVELEKLMLIVEHPLPDREQLRQIAVEIAGDLPDEPNTTRVLEAAAGMTRYEAENAFSLSMIEHDMLLPEPLWQMKANMLRQSSALRLYRGEIPCLGGLEAYSQPRRLHKSFIATDRHGFSRILIRNNESTKQTKRFAIDLRYFRSSVCFVSKNICVYLRHLWTKQKEKNDDVT